MPRRAPWYDGVLLTFGLIGGIGLIIMDLLGML